MIIDDNPAYGQSMYMYMYECNKIFIYFFIDFIVENNTRSNVLLLTEDNPAYSTCSGVFDVNGHSSSDVVYETVFFKSCFISTIIIN